MQDFSKARTEVEVFSERGTFIEKLLLYKIDWNGGATPGG